NHRYRYARCVAGVIQGYQRQVATTRTTSAPRWAHLFRGNLARVAGVAASALLFGVLLLLVRVQWLPLESVDRGLAATLNHAVAGHGLTLVALRFVTTLGSHGVLGWLVAIAVVLLVVRHRYRL